MLAEYTRKEAQMTTSSTGFRQRLAERQKKLGHALCVGLDPDYVRIPDDFKYPDARPSDEILFWMMRIVDQTAEFATVFKPQSAYYERFGWRGVKALCELVQHIRENHPEVPILLDCKRGDIDRTQMQYRDAVFGAYLGVDAANVSPYMGKEPVACMHDNAHPERGIISLIYTSNKGAREVQDITVIHPDTGEHMPHWYFMANKVLGWAKEAGITNLGFVMAAAHKKDERVYADHLVRCRQLDEGVPFYLMPGFGAQGGFVEASVEAAWAGPGSVCMNSSSGISNDLNPAEAAKRLGGQIGEAISKYS